MAKKPRSFQNRIGNGFFMLGPLTSGGLTYRISPETSEENELKNANNTDAAQGQSIIEGTEDQMF